MDDDRNSKRDEHMKHVITFQLLEFLPKLRILGISLSDDGNVFGVQCRPCNKCISYSTRAKLSNLVQHLDGKGHRNKVSNTLTNFENWFVQKKWEEVSLDANGFLMFEHKNSGITVDQPPIESMTEQEKQVLLQNTSSVVSVNLSEIFYANTIEPLKIGYLCHACAIILNPTPTSEIIISHVKSTTHTKKLLQWMSTNMEAKLLDIPSDLASLFSENFLQHKEKEVYCISCSAHLQNVDSLINHTSSKDHTKKLNSFMQLISTVTILNLDEDLTNKDFQPSLSAAANSILSSKTGRNRESTDLKPKPIQTSDELISLKSSHHIIGLHCKACSVNLQTPPNILSHINGKKHQTQLREYNFKQQKKLAEPQQRSLKLQTKDSISDQPNPMMIPDDLKPLISQHLLEHLENEIYCAACAVHLQTIESLMDHTNSKKHLAKLNLFMQTISTGKDFQSSLSAEASYTLLLNSVKTQESTDLKLKLVANLHCKICRVDLPSSHHTLAHEEGIKHKAQLLKFKVKLKEKLEKSSSKNSNPQTTDSISDQPRLNLEDNSTSKDFESSSSAGANSILPLESYIIGNNFYCKICHVDLTNSGNILSHINGKNHQTQLEQFKVIQERFAKPQNKSNRNEAIDASTDANDNSPTVLKISENDMNIDMNTIIKPLNTERNQKCLQREISLLDGPNGSLNNEIQATVPLSTSPEFTTAMSTSIRSALISTPSAASSTPSLCNSSINDSTSDQPNLMKIPDEMKPLISKHLLRQLETEIYCDTCSVRLQSAQSVVQHTKSRRHKLNLKDRREREKLKRQLNMFEEKLQQPNRLTPNHFLPDTNTPLRETNLCENNRKADSNYSSIDINEIYRVNPEKLRIIEMSCELCFPKSPQSLYCLICEKSTTNNIQNFYEHMFSDLHLQYLADLEANDLLYVDYPNQFSNLTLLKEFIMELTDETFQCVICDALVLNLDAEISVHIKEAKHINQKQRLNKLSKEKFLKTVLQHTQSYHDIINVYWCELCDFSSNSALAFAKHSSHPTDNACLEQRSSHECNIIYDSCVPCASLWLGSMHDYARHCKTKFHKHNVQDYQIIKEITLPREAIIYLKHAVQKVEELIQLSNQVVTKEQSKVGTLLKCLEETVEPVFPKAKAYPFGSRMSGLGFPDSDIDVFLDCGTYFRTTVSEKQQQRIIDEVTHRLCNNKKLWKIEEVLTGGRIPIIKSYHQSTELKCDISFKNGLSVENTKLLKCFVDNCPMVRRLILFLKKWLAICKLSGSRYITNYALCWWVIFYLQSKTILPSVADLIRQRNESKTVAGWETGICEKFVPHLPDDSFLSLLQGFFKYYAIFNFRKCVACPLLGYTVYKEDFEDLSSLPLEMAPYINQLRAAIDHAQLFRIDSPMCIQDPYDLAHNLTKAVSELDLGIFKQFCEASAEVLNSDFKMP